MKYGNIFFCTMLGMGISCLCSCISKERKAFESAVQSRELTKMRQFLALYPEADSQLLDSAKVIIEKWASDSADFAVLKKTEDIVERYGLEMSYMDQHPDGLYLDSVEAMFQDDETKAAAAIERQEKIEQHLATYCKQFENRVFYMDPYHYIILSCPDDKGKGAGVLVDGLLTVYDFRYNIDIEDLEEDEISCEYTVDGRKFTLEAYDKHLYYSAQGEIETFTSKPLL